MAITNAGSQGRSSASAAAAATSIVDSFGRGVGAEAFAAAFAASAAKDAASSAIVFAKAAAGARRRGFTEQFGREFVSAAQLPGARDIVLAVSPSHSVCVPDVSTLLEGVGAAPDRLSVACQAQSCSRTLQHAP